MRGREVSRDGATRHTPCSRVAAALSVALALTVGGLRSSATPPWVAVLVGAVVLVGTAAGVKLWRDNCFESRLVAVVLSIGVAIPLLVAGDTRSRARAPKGRPPYAH